MKNILLTAVAALIYFVAPAQDKAKEVLDKLTSTLNAYQTIDIRFSFITNDQKANQTETKEGRVLSKGKSFKLVLEEVEVYSNGTTKYTVMDDTEEINIQSVDPKSSDMLDNPIKFFTVSNKEFTYAYKGSSVVGGKAMEEVEFYPKDKKAAYSSIRLQVEKNTMHPYTVSYIGRDGVSYTVKVKSFTPNTTIDDKSLAFNQAAYSGYEVVDLR